MKKRDQARSTWKRLNTPQSRQEYQECRNHVKRLISETRRSYSCDKLATNRRDFWQRIRNYELTSTSKGDKTDNDICGREGMFNAHVAAVGPDIAAEVANQCDRDAITGLRPYLVCSSALVLRSVALHQRSS